MELKIRFPFLFLSAWTFHPLCKPGLCWKAFSRRFPLQRMPLWKKRPRTKRWTSHILSSSRSTNHTAGTKLATLSFFKKTSDKAGEIQAKSPDLLRLCHTVPLEVVNMGMLQVSKHTHTLIIIIGVVYSQHTIKIKCSLCLNLMDCHSSIQFIWRWERLWPPEGRLLWVPGLATVLLRGRNDKCQGPQWQDDVVQCELWEPVAFCPWRYTKAKLTLCWNCRASQAPWHPRVRVTNKLAIYMLY